MAGTVPHANEVNPLRIVQAIRDLFAGRSNAVGTLTITPNAATTVVTASNCSIDSRVTITPTSAAAATEYGAGTCYVSAKGAGTFTVTHSNSATTGRTFDWHALG